MLYIHLSDFCEAFRTYYIHRYSVTMPTVADLRHYSCTLCGVKLNLCYKRFSSNPTNPQCMPAAVKSYLFYSLLLLPNFPGLPVRLQSFPHFKTRKKHDRNADRRGYDCAEVRRQLRPKNLRSRARNRSGLDTWRGLENQCLKCTSTVYSLLRAR